MTVSPAIGSVVANAGETISLGGLFSIAGSADPPTYLILSALDRDEYTTGYSTADMGTLSGDGTIDDFTNFDGDGWSVGIVFTYQPQTGLYYNKTYGYFNQLTFATSSFITDNVSFSLFTTSDRPDATEYASDPYVLAENPDVFTYDGSVSVVTEPAACASAPSQATPESICAAALSFVGDAWNDEGCWTLASNIAAEAGASVPVISSLVGVAGVANGEWIVAYNGPVSANSNWESLLTAGEMVVFVPAGGGGHITTVVSGSGASSELVDNITYVNAGGTIVNPANDGSSSDIIVEPPHAASQEFTGVDDSTVVVYELDTPVVSDLVASASVGADASRSLGGLFTATNPLASQSVTEWQVYDTDANDSLSVGSTVDTAAHSAADALTVASLGAATLLAGNVAGTDTLDVRAYNGNYWGDWESLPVVVTQTSGNIACFLTGTRIATPNGEASVETLRPGDLVRLASGDAAPVRWIGWHTLSSRLGDPVRLWPIRIRASALAANVPHRDLLLSPGHALYLDGILLDAGTLVNGTSIVREPPATETFIYWHVELDTHALILAEGAPVETLLDGLEELPFDNAASRPVPCREVQELPYPRCKSARQVPRTVRAAGGTLAAEAPAASAHGAALMRPVCRVASVGR
jgi:hypothetical protein